MGWGTWAVSRLADSLNPVVVSISLDISSRVDLPSPDPAVITRYAVNRLIDCSVGRLIG